VAIQHDGSPSPVDPFDQTVGPTDAPAAPKKRRKRDPLPFWMEMPILILVALVVAVVIKTFLVQAFYIPSSSMEDTLQVNDRVMVNKLAYRFGDIARGHIIVFDDPHGETVTDEGFVSSVFRNVAEAVGLSTPRSEVIKRVIGLPGETVEISGGVVLIDGSPINEPYVRDGSVMADEPPVVVPPGHVFVMGDNRNASQDSRVFGPIPEDEIVGRAFVIIWPPGRWGGL